VRARKAYVTPKKAEAVTTSSKSPMTPELREALDSPLPVSGLTMHVRGAVQRRRAQRVGALRCRARPRPETGPEHEAMLSHVAIDATGKINKATPIR
jgi:hypothetical protein